MQETYDFLQIRIFLIIPSLQTHLQWPQRVRQSPWCQSWWRYHSPGSLSTLCSVSLWGRSSCQYGQSSQQSLWFKPVLSIFIPECSKKWFFQYQFKPKSSTTIKIWYPSINLRKLQPVLRRITVRSNLHKHCKQQVRRVSRKRILNEK